jgi:lipoate-protein ligase A
MTSERAASWRLIETGPRDAAFNMGLDEALFETSDSGPTLRLYRWDPSALSIGYFQPAAAFADLRRSHPNVPVVRRLTGGGAIFHARDWTFSLTGTERAIGLPSSIPESYRRIHEAVERGLAKLGLSVSLREERTALSDRRGKTPFCFARSHPLDLVLAGRKLAGSAQRRAGGRILHHGTIVVEPNPMVPEAAAIHPGPVSEEIYSEIARALADGFSETFSVTWERTEPRAEERDLALRLAEDRYGADAWLRRR